MGNDTTCGANGAASRSASGFPSPAEDVAESSLDLQALMVRRPAATFFLRMRGEAMRGAGVFAGDLLVVDRSLRPTARRLIVLAVDGALLVRRYLREVASRGVLFIAAGDGVSEAVSLDAGAGDDAGDDVGDDAGDDIDASHVVVWGVVTYVIHRADTLPENFGGDDSGDDRAGRFAAVRDVQ